MGKNAFHKLGRRLGVGNKQWLTAYADGDYDPSLWDNQTETGLIYAEVDDSYQAGNLLDLTEEQRRQLQQDGQVSIDRDGQTFLVTMI